MRNLSDLRKHSESHFLLYASCSKNRRIYAEESGVPGRDVVLDFYFELRNFLNIYERVDEHYVIYGQHDEEGRFVIKLFAWIRPLICRSVWIREMLRFFFSANAVAGSVL